MKRIPRQQSQMVRKSSLLKEFEEDPTMTAPEVAEIFRVDASTVTNWANQGKFGYGPENIFFLPVSHEGHGQVRIRKSAVERLLKEQETKVA